MYGHLAGRGLKDSFQLMVDLSNQVYCISNHFTTKKDWQSTFVFLFCIFSFFTSSKEIVCFIVWKMADPAWKEIIDSATVFQVFRIEVRRIFMLYDWLPQIKSLLFLRINVICLLLLVSIFKDQGSTLFLVESRYTN